MPVRVTLCAVEFVVQNGPLYVILAVGGAVTTIFTVDVTALHGLMPVVVSVKVAVPEKFDAGVQVEMSEFALLKLPLGAVQVAPVAEPPILPDRAVVVPP